MKLITLVQKAEDYLRFSIFMLYFLGVLFIKTLEFINVSTDLFLLKLWKFQYIQLFFSFNFLWFIYLKYKFALFYLKKEKEKHVKYKLKYVWERCQSKEKHFKSWHVENALLDIIIVLKMHCLLDNLYIYINTSDSKRISQVYITI